MAWSKADLVQRGHHFAIVDEVDSILIDEARTPLIISGPAETSAKWYGGVRPDRAAAQARRPLRGGGGQAHRRHHRGGRRVRRGPARHREPLRGGQHPADRLPEQLAEGQGALPPRPAVHRQQRRGAHRRRVHRPRAGRPPLQRGHAPGHRGQGEGEDQGREPDPRHDHPAELLPALREALRDDRYGLRPRPPSCTRPTSWASSRSRRTGRWSARTSSDVIYKTEKAKFDAVVDDIAERHEAGQPVLVGTASVEKSEVLSKYLLKRGHPARGAEREEPRP